MELKLPTRRCFTPAAREAGRAVRRAKALQREDIAAPQVFVVRRTSFPDPFAWEIRRFGGMVLDRSDVGFPSIPLARAAGGEVLSLMSKP